MSGSVAKIPSLRLPPKGKLLQLNIVPDSMYPIRRESTSQSESDSASEEEEEEGIPLLPVGDDSGDSDDTLMKSPRGRGGPKK